MTFSELLIFIEKKYKITKLTHYKSINKKNSLKIYI